MDIPIDAEVKCADQSCGRSICVVLNPITREITHLVVQTHGFIHSEILVPIELIVESTPHLIRLRCTRRELGGLEPFTRTEYLDPVEAGYGHTPLLYPGKSAVLWPYVTPAEGWEIPVEVEQVPARELAVRHGAAVNATDGRIGRVDEFLVDPHTGHITHLVLREGHLWGQKDVTIPISDIDRIEDDEVTLTLDRQAVDQLPGIPIQRWWRR